MVYKTYGIYSGAFASLFSTSTAFHLRPMSNRGYIIIFLFFVLLMNGLMPRHAKGEPKALPLPKVSYQIFKYEVSIEEFALFCEAVGKKKKACTQDENKQNETNKKLPVRNISWYEAKEYAAWLSDSDPDYRYRLPTSEEWEYAAGGGKKTSYFWGENRISACRYANVADRSARSAGVIPPVLPIYPCDDGHARLAPVGSYQSNAFGLHDMTGNVWEWVENCDPTYKTPNGCSNRLVRGGSWFNGPKGTRTKTLESYPPDKGHPLVGFRLIREKQ